MSEPGSIVDIATVIQWFPFPYIFCDPLNPRLHHAVRKLLQARLSVSVLLVGSLDRGVTKDGGVYYLWCHFHCNSLHPSIAASIELSLGLSTPSPPDDRAGNSLVEVMH